jgi:hypothetical protein
MNSGHVLRPVDPTTAPGAALPAADPPRTDTARLRPQILVRHYDATRWSHDDILAGRAEPLDSLTDIGNLLTAVGAQDMLNGLSTSGLSTPYTSANAALCVADGNPTALAANATFTNGSTTVTCSTTSGPNVGDSIRLNSDGSWYTVTAVTANTSFTISTAYTGVTGTGAGAYISQAAVGNTSNNYTSTAVGSGVSGVSNANPSTITTSSAHGLIVGQVVVIASVGGATGANGTWVVATVPSSTTFTISLASSPGVYTSGGTVSLANTFTQLVNGSPTQDPAVGGGITGVTNSTSPTITTSSAHGLVVGNMVTIASVGGATGVNGTWAVASVPSSTTFTVTLTSTAGSYTSGGTVNFANALQFVSVFAAANANYTWNEWSLTQRGTAQSGGHLFNRKIVYLQGKSNTVTTTFTVTLTVA